MKASLFRFILLVLMFVLSAPYLASAGDAPPDNVKKVAREGVDALVKGRRIDGPLKDLGFESQIDIESAELGQGIEIFTIRPDKLLDESAPQDLQSLVTSTNQWCFLILAGNKAKTVITVGLVNGKNGYPLTLALPGLQKH